MLIVTSQTGRDTDTQRRTVLVVTSQTDTATQGKRQLCWL